VFHRSSWSNKLIKAKDHASVQLNVGHLGEDGVFNGDFSTIALAGNVRAMVRISHSKYLNSVHENPIQRERFAPFVGGGKGGGGGGPSVCEMQPCTSMLRRSAGRCIAAWVSVFRGGRVMGASFSATPSQGNGGRATREGALRSWRA